MVVSVVNKHRLWDLVEKSLQGSVKLPVKLTLRPDCLVLINTNGTIQTVTIEAKRPEITFSRETFALNPDGSLDVTVTADIVSALTGKVHVATHTDHYTLENQKHTNILGFARAQEQLEVLADILSEVLTQETKSKKD